MIILSAMVLNAAFWSARLSILNRRFNRNGDEPPDFSNTAVWWLVSLGMLIGSFLQSFLG